MDITTIDIIACKYLNTPRIQHLNNSDHFRFQVTSFKTFPYI